MKMSSSLPKILETGINVLINNSQIITIKKFFYKFSVSSQEHGKHNIGKNVVHSTDCTTSAKQSMGKMTSTAISQSGNVPSPTYKYILIHQK